MDVNNLIEKVCGKQPLPTSSKAMEYRSWYVGKVDDFHNYTIYNGRRNIKMTKRSLQMAESVCRDWADLLGNENTQFHLPDTEEGNPNETRLNDILRKNDFTTLLNNAIEKTFAVGNGAFVLGLKNFLTSDITGEIRPTDKTEISIDFVDIFSMKPITISNHKLIECAFLSESTDYKEVSIHKLNEQNEYDIINIKFNDEKVLEEWTYKTHSTKPWFFHLRPNINNNSFFYDDLGTSIYANAIDVLKSIDDIFDSFVLEYILSRRKVYVSAKATKFEVSTSKDGKTQINKTFDPFDYTYYELPSNSATDQKPFVMSDSPDIRYDAYINGLNTMLNLLSKKVGFGTERYKFDKGSVATATQIISENSDMARSLRKHENLLKNVLVNMAYTIIDINNNYTLQDKFSEIDYNDINVTFDDSIIEDKNAIMERDRADVQAGLMSEVEYRIKHYGETEEEAKQSIIDFFLFKEIDKYINALQQGVMTPEEFVLKTYGEEKPELVKYIEEQLAKAEMQSPIDLFEETAEDEEV